MLIARSSAMQPVHVDIELAARSDAKVLITGEPGVGKEVVAHNIHSHSRRRTAPFVAIDCAGVPDVLLESEFVGHTSGGFTGGTSDRPGRLLQAHTGTVFLNEVGEMSPRLQALLLRFLDTGEIGTVDGDAPKKHTDVRVIASTNVDLPAAVDTREFRDDLYYRLNMVHVRIPPLRERQADIPLLANHFLRACAQESHLPQPTLTPAALEVLVRYRWPGNIRELRSMMERAMLRLNAATIDAADLPVELAAHNDHA